MNRSKNVDITYLLFIIGYFLLVSDAILTRVTFLVSLFDLLKIVAYVILVISIIIQYRKLKTNFIYVFIFILLSIICCYFSKSNLPMKLCLILLASKNIEFDSFIQNDFIVKIFLVCFVIAMHFLGYTNDYIIYRDGLARNSMGFSHPNTFGFYIMILCFEYSYLKVKKRSKFNIFDILCFCLLVLVIDTVSDSRSSVFSIIIFLCYLIFGKSIYKKIANSKVTSIVCSNFFIVCALLSAISTYMLYMNKDIGLFINKILSGRLFYNIIFFKKYGISLFGQELLLISTEQAKLTNTASLVLDNSYFHLLLRYGLFYFCMMSEFFRRSFRSIISKNSYELFGIMLILLLYGMTEASIFRIEMCPFLLYFSNILFYKKEKCTNE